MANEEWWRRHWRAGLTVLSGGVMLGSFIARDQILSGTQDELRGLDAAATTISVQTAVSNVNLGVLTAVNMLSHPTAQQCAPETAAQVKTVGDGRAEAVCVLSTYAGTKPILDTLTDAARQMPSDSQRAAKVAFLEKVWNGMGEKALQLQDVVQKDTRPDNASLSTDLAMQLTKTYTDISSFIQVMATMIQQERESIEAERQSLNHKAKVATFWTDGLFLLGWIITVGAKLEGVDDVVE
jgi:hypothetical protein